MNQTIPMGSDFMPQAETMAGGGGGLFWPIFGIIIFAAVVALISYKIFLE